MDLLTYLLADFLESRRGPQSSPAEADLATQELEFILDNEHGNENHLLFAYATLDREERATIAPSVHEWFLERFGFGRKPWFPEREVRLADSLADTFLLSASPTVSMLAVNALLAIEQEGPQYDQRESGIALLSSRVIRESAHPLDDLILLADVLFDLQILSLNRGPVLRGLRQLGRLRYWDVEDPERREMVAAFKSAFAELVAERAASLGDAYSEELRGVQSDMDQS